MIFHTFVCSIPLYATLSIYTTLLFESVFLTQVETNRRMVYAGLDSDPSMDSEFVSKLSFLCVSV